MAALPEPSSSLPVVSIVVPCLNEEQFIRRCLDSIIANDYPKERLEVFVVDGMSGDRTREIVGEYQARHAFVRRLDNVKKAQSAALNIGIRAAAGELIMRIDAHAVVPPDYISKCVKYSLESGADNVGGRVVVRPRRETIVGKAIVCALSHPFGVGNSRFRTMPQDAPPRWADTAYAGCYRREVFDRVGGYDERIERSEDTVMNAKIRRSGGKILLVPEIVSYTYARSTLRSFWAHNFDNGRWAVLPFQYSGLLPVPLRHLIPLLFLVALVSSGVLSWIFPAAWPVFLAVAGLYLVANLAASATIALREGEWQYLLVLPLVFGALHLAYGLGSLAGLVRIAASRMSR